jgi:hypothetical protein
MKLYLWSFSVFFLSFKVITNNGEVNERVSSLRRLEIDPASVETSLVLADVIEEEESRVGGRVEVTSVAEASGGLLAPRGGVGSSGIVPAT